MCRSVECINVGQLRVGWSFVCRRFSHQYNINISIQYVHNYTVGQLPTTVDRFIFSIFITGSKAASTNEPSRRHSLAGCRICLGLCRYDLHVVHTLLSMRLRLRFTPFTNYTKTEPLSVPLTESKTRLCLICYTNSIVSTYCSILHHFCIRLHAK